MSTSIRSNLRATARNLVRTRHRLAYEFLLNRVTGRMEPELVHLARIAPGGSIAVDIGANQGFYSYALSRLFRRVLAFEPNSSIAADLERCSAANIEVHKVALSARNGRRDLFVPQVGGVEHHGWASFNPLNLPDATAVTSLEVPVRSLDSYHLDGVDFIKVDVEGHEPEVLAGALDTVRRYRPTVLVEVRRSNFPKVQAMFDSLGYAVSRLANGQLVPWSIGQGWAGENFVFQPQPAARAAPGRRRRAGGEQAV